MTTSDARRFLVPVADSVTLRNTVAYAVEAASEAAGRGEASLHFVVVARGRSVDPETESALESTRELLERVEVWAEEDRDEGVPIAFETDVIGTNRYLFGPGDYADELHAYLEDEGIDRIVLDPEYAPGGSAPMLQPLAQELAQRGIDVEEAPVERPAKRTALARAGTLRKYLVVFAASLSFYLLLGELTTLDVLTGSVTAAITALLLAPVAFGKQPSISRLGVQLARMAIYAPYLLWEIAKANLQIAYVVLHPSLPIDPEMVEFRAAVWNDAAVTTLANSITLTPGTLTVDVSQRAFTIHSLTAGAREDLFAGGLERAVRFVFYGRAAARIASPAERGEGQGSSDESAAEDLADGEVTADD